MSREQDYISLARKHAANLLDSYNALKGMQLEWNSLDYSTNLDDGEGDNTGVTKAEVSAVVFTTTDALTTFLESGHGTNLARLL